jgi:hypothetical protein
MDPKLELLRSMDSMATIWPKSQNSNLGHDGALFLRNFVECLFRQTFLHFVRGFPVLQLADQHYFCCLWFRQNNIFYDSSLLFTYAAGRNIMNGND